MINHRSWRSLISFLRQISFGSKFSIQSWKFWLLLLIMFSLSFFKVSYLLCILFFAHAHIRTKGGISHLLHVVKLICCHHIFFFNFGKFLSNKLGIVLLSLLRCKKANVLFNLLTKSLRNIILTFLFKLVEFTHFRQWLVIYIFLKESSFSKTILENHKTKA